ncbi:putative multiple sugar transport system permease protein [Actinoplanes tereljensis]|uniref:Xylose transport system permease protein XylH n=1 Tax=Paractinoplanes tereljensis TaxID=571912 RepID=A0A919TZI7_9ACTN|nr:multiple monosaccharide ABC transporter permease [Actinoplanes tereljensis]GIF26315.1 ABC transporter permease [Actinoplanes tereljensis]
MTTMEKNREAAPPGQKLTTYLGQNLRQYGMMAALVVIVVLFQITTDGKLLYPNNIAALIQQNAYVLILAIGMVMVIVAGHIDLSVGSVVAFIGGICALLISDHNVPWLLAVVISIAIGGLVGCWQGFWIAYVGIPAFIVTLGGMLLFRGLAIVLVGTTVAGLPTSFNDISNGSLPNALGFLGDLDGLTLLIGIVAIAGLAAGQIRARRSLLHNDLRVEPFAAFAGKLVISAAVIAYITYLLAKSAGGTPIVLIIVGVLVLLYTFIMTNTVFGRHIYAMGGNLPAAMLSGVKTKRVNFMIFVNMGLLAGVAAVVTTSRAGAAVAAAGNNFELDAIAAAFIGGTAVSGGIGKVTGAIIGAFIMGVLNMGLSIMNVDPAWQMAVKGLVLIAAVAFDITNKRRAK